MRCACKSDPLGVDRSRGWKPAGRRSSSCSCIAWQCSGIIPASTRWPSPATGCNQARIPSGFQEEITGTRSRY